MHIQWLERSAIGHTEPPEIDIVIFPEEADFVKVMFQLPHTLNSALVRARYPRPWSCCVQVEQPGARIMQLRYKDSTREDLFFW